MATAVRHHSVQAEAVPGFWVPAKPLRFSNFWERWRRERNCRKAIGHCYHPADAMIAWYCCECGKDVDGMPPQKCTHCSPG